MYTFHLWCSQNVLISRKARRTCRLALLAWQRDFPVTFSRQKFLADLAKAPDYRNASLFPGTVLADAPQAHGPYAAERLTPERFAALQPAQYRIRFRQVLYRQDFPEPDTLAADYAEDMFLRDWPPGARFFELCLAHDFTLFQQPGFQLDFPCAEKLLEFTEFVVVMEQMQQAGLVVFAAE